MRTVALVLLALAVACETPSSTPTPAASAPAPAPPSASSIAPAPSASTAPVVDESLDERAARVHRESIVVDGHDDIPSVIAASGFDLAKPNGKTHTDLPRMKAGGITGEFFSIFVDKSYVDRPSAARGSASRRALDLIDVTYQQVERHKDALVLATSADEIRRAKREGKIAILMGIEGGHAIENSLATLREMHRLGVRYMTLTHTNTNDWADSSGLLGPAPVKHHGLTDFGKEVVREMQRIGMLVDVSHVSDETFFAAIETAKAPIIASHSSARAIADHRRNLTDDMLRALAKNGGIAMVNFWSAFIDPKYVAAQGRFMQKHGKDVEALFAKYRDDMATFKVELDKLRAEDPMPSTPLSVLVDHIDHMAKIAGVDHVGLGSDFDGCDALPEGITGIDGLPKITRALLERGWSEADVKKVLGENFLRVFAAAEAYAKSTGTTLSGDGSTRRIAQ